VGFPPSQTKLAGRCSDQPVVTVTTPIKKKHTMTETNSTPRHRRRKHQSAKPHKDFPLTAHPSGRWCKKVRGKVWFFGKLDDECRFESCSWSRLKSVERRE
jgi:hypothetical protein